MNATQQVIAQLDDKINELTDLKGKLSAWLMAGAPSVPPPAVQTPRPPVVKVVKVIKPVEEKPKRKYTRRAITATPEAPQKKRGGASPVVAPVATDEKPVTIGGAMKYLARGFKRAFTKDDIMAGLEADADFKSIIEASENPGNAIAFNLSYWTKTGKLNRSGEGAEATYKVVDLNF